MKLSTEAQIIGHFGIQSFSFDNKQFGNNQS
jgi:hypothetical protein